MADYHFTISLNTFDTSLLPTGSPAKGTEGYSAAVHQFLQEQFAGFKGNARIVVSEDSIQVEWTPPSSEKDPIEAAVTRLEKGEFVPAIVMLELLRQHQPDDTRLLYNLGLAYSDVGRLDEARAVLNELLQLDPGNVNGRIALGVTYAKEERNREAVEILERAVADDPQNPWGQRNLGGCLLALGDVERATACLLRSTELNPKDQQAFYGLAEAYRAASNYAEADAAYRTVIGIDEYSQFAQQAKKRFSSLAQEGFRQKLIGVPRPDAVMYCLSALKHFDGLSQEKIQQIVFEIGMLGTKGFEVNDPAQQYQLRSMPGRFSGLHLVSFLYVGFKQIAPEHNAGFDLSEEYEVACKMFEEKKGK